MDITQHDGAGRPARRTVLLGTLGALGAAAAAPVWVAPAHAASALGPVAGLAPAAPAGSETGYLWPDRSPVLANELADSDAAQTTANGYVVDRGPPAPNRFEVAAVLGTGRLYGRGSVAGRRPLAFRRAARGADW